MILSVNSISDSTIVSMLAEGNSSAWEQLYDKYAPMMYGVVLKIAKDEKLSEEIFKECFFQLKENSDIEKERTNLCPFLLKFTYDFTLNYFKILGLTTMINDEINKSNDFLIQLLSSQHKGKKGNMEQQEIRKKLREEFNKLRNEQKQKVVAGDILNAEINA